MGDFALDVPRRYMFLDAGIDWTVPLAGGNIGLRGQATYNERNPPPNAVPSHKLAIHGDATIFGETFASVDATLEGPRVQFGTTWHGGVPPGAQFGARELLAVTTTYTVDFANGTACGRAEPTTGAGVTCSAEVCFHAAQAPTLTSSCNFVCGDHICGATGVPLPGLEYCGGADGGGRCFTDCGKCDDVIGGCGRDADCKSGNCVARLCQPSLYCGDGYCGLHGIPLAGTEACGYGSTGGACQSDCGLCPLMGICDQDNDCQSGACRGRLCVQRCGDGVCNGLETCGGVNNGAACTSDCGKCGNPGPCSTNRDCQSGYCAGVVCAPNPCGNGHCDNVPGVEQCGYGNGGPECEQDCGLCNGGGPCNSNNDCKSGTCTAAGLCAPCGDGVCSSLGGPHTTSPGLESCGEGNSGLSCEQDCGLCRDGSVCDSNADCTSGYCAGAALGIGICTANPCGNGTCDWIPGVEWCGAGNTQPMCQQDCGLCGIGGTCTTDADCGSDNCVGRLCGLRRYDCGDGLCADVPVEIPGADDVQPSCRTDCGLARPGGYCDHDADCRDGVCIPGYGLPGACAACGDGQCTFGLENCGSGDHGVVCESDCGRCGVGGACTRGADCKSGNCVGIACGSSCGDGTCDATESCGGSDNGVACYTDCGRCGTWGPCLTGNDCAGARICTVALGCQWPL